MPFLFGIFFAEQSEDKFADLKNIANKIIPNDPIAIIVQLIATFILILILAKFLVGPAKKYIANRQAYIQGNIDEANDKNSKATTYLDEANSKLKDAKVTSKEMVENAKVTALNEKDRILEEAKLEAEQIKKKAREDIESERQKMKQELTDEVIDVAILAASKVVEREISEKDNVKIIESFINSEDKE